MGNNKPRATDIYERQEMAAEGQGGSVLDDIADLSMEDMFDYFGDTDPTEFL